MNTGPVNGTPGSEGACSTARILCRTPGRFAWACRHPIEHVFVKLTLLEVVIKLVAELAEEPCSDGDGADRGAGRGAARARAHRWPADRWRAGADVLCRPRGN